MKLLLTSSGVTNESIRAALVRLLGKPIEQASALFVPTGMYPFAGGPGYAWTAIAGTSQNALVKLGWKSFGNLELSVLPSLDRELWEPAVRETDALLVWGGDPVFLAHWFRQSGLADVIGPNTVYVGTSAGSIMTAAVIGEMFGEPRRARGETLATEHVVLPEGNLERTFVLAPGMGWVEFSIIPHYAGTGGHGDASPANAAVWAAKIGRPTYAIDDATALAVVDGTVEVVSEGVWKLY